MYLSNLPNVVQSIGEGIVHTCHCTRDCEGWTLEVFLRRKMNLLLPHPRSSSASKSSVGGRQVKLKKNLAKILWIAKSILNADDHPYPISDLLNRSPLTCQNAWMWLGDPFKGNQDPSHIEGWDLEMIESWGYRLKCESGWKDFCWISNDKSRRSLVVRPSKICGLPAKLRFLLNFCKSAAASVQKCANCPVSLHSPAQQNHLRWTMTIMIKSYDDRYVKHCSW